MSIVDAVRGLVEKRFSFARPITWVGRGVAVAIDDIGLFESEFGESYYPNSFEIRCDWESISEEEIIFERQGNIEIRV